MACFVSPVEPPSIKAIVEKYYTGLLGYTASISDKVMRKEYIEKVIRICHRKAQMPSKYDFTEKLMLTDSFFDKVAYEKDIGKVIEKSHQCIQNISKRSVKL